MFIILTMLMMYVRSHRFDVGYVVNDIDLFHSIDQQ